MDEFLAITIIGEKLTKTIFGSVLLLIVSLLLTSYYGTSLLKEQTSHDVLLPGANVLLHWVVQGAWWITGIVFCIFLIRHIFESK